MEFGKVMQGLIIKYAVICCALILSVVLPEQIVLDNGYNLCLFNAVTGHECPFCGMTRSVFEFVHLRLISAISYNPLVLFFPPMLAIELVSDITKNEVVKRIRKIIAFTFVAGLLVLSAVRIFQVDGLQSEAPGEVPSGTSEN